MSLCEDCVKGVRDEGNAEGKIESIGEIECHIATPTGDFPKHKVLLFLADGFGISLINSKLLVDDFARNGFRTVAPDILNGDPLPENLLESKCQFPFPDWLKLHGAEEIRPAIDKVITAPKEQGVTHIGRYCFDLAFRVLGRLHAWIGHKGRSQRS